MNAELEEMSRVVSNLKFGKVGWTLSIEIRTQIVEALFKAGYRRSDGKEVGNTQS